MTVELGKAKHWRIRAEEIRAQAEQTRDPWVAGRLRELAEKYDELAANEAGQECDR